MSADTRPIELSQTCSLNQPRRTVSTASLLEGGAPGGDLAYLAEKIPNGIMTAHAAAMNHPCATNLPFIPSSPSTEAEPVAGGPGGAPAGVDPGGGRFSFATKLAALCRNPPCLPVAVVTLNLTVSAVSGAVHTSSVVLHFSRRLYRVPPQPVPAP